MQTPFFGQSEKRSREDDEVDMIWNPTMSRLCYARVIEVGTRTADIEQRNQTIVKIAKPLPGDYKLPGRNIYWFVTSENVSFSFDDTNLFLWTEQAQVTADGNSYYLNQINFRRNKNGHIRIWFPDGLVETILCYSTASKSNKRRKLNSPVSISTAERGTNNNNQQYVLSDTTMSNTNQGQDEIMPSLSTDNSMLFVQAPQELLNGRQIPFNIPVVINILLLVPEQDTYIQMAEEALLDIGFTKEVSSETKQRLYSQTKLINKQQHVLLFPYGNMKRYCKIDDYLPFASEVLLLLENRKQQSALMAVKNVIDIDEMDARPFKIKTKSIPTTDVSFKDLTEAAKRLFFIDKLQSVNVLGGLSCKMEATISDFLLAWNLGPAAGHVAQNVYLCFKFEPEYVTAFTKDAAITLKALNISYQEALTVNGSVLVYIRGSSSLPWFLLQQAEEIFHQLEEEQLTEIYECFISDIDASLNHPNNKAFVHQLTYFKEMMISDGISVVPTSNRFRLAATSIAPKSRIQNVGAGTKDFEDLTNCDEQNVLYLQNRGYTKRMLDDYQGALEDLNRAHELEPNDAFTLQYRGDTKRLLGDFNGALRDLNRADELEPNDAFTLQTRGVTKYELKDYKGGLKDLKAAAKLDPNNTYIISIRVQAYIALNMMHHADVGIALYDELVPYNTEFAEERSKVEEDFLKRIPIAEIQKLKLLGDSGFGEVYLADWNGEKVVLKRFYGLDSDREFEMTQRMYRTFQHENIVTSFGHCCGDNEEMSLIMEYADGGSLYDLLHEQHAKLLTRDEILSYACDIASGIAYLHKKRVIHRDLKGSNVLLFEGRRIAKIADFGQSRFLNERSLARTVVDTPYYMAPEVLSEEPYGKSADVYSLLYEMCTKGILPILTEKKRKERIMYYVTDTEFRHLILRCCQEDALKRPTIEECLDILKTMKVSNSTDK